MFFLSFFSSPLKMSHLSFSSSLMRFWRDTKAEKTFKATTNQARSLYEWLKLTYDNTIWDRSIWAGARITLAGKKRKDLSKINFFTNFLTDYLSSLLRSNRTNNWQQRERGERERGKEREKKGEREERIVPLLELHWGKITRSVCSFWRRVTVAKKERKKKRKILWSSDCSIFASANKNSFFFTYIPVCDTLLSLSLSSCSLSAGILSSSGRRKKYFTCRSICSESENQPNQSESQSALSLSSLSFSVVRALRSPSSFFLSLLENARLSFVRSFVRSFSRSISQFSQLWKSKEKRLRKERKKKEREKTTVLLWKTHSILRNLFCDQCGDFFQWIKQRQFCQEFYHFDWGEL